MSEKSPFQAIQYIKNDVVEVLRYHQYIKYISPNNVVYFQVSTVAGTSNGFADGDALTVSQFSLPSGAAVDTGGNTFVADYVRLF